MNVRGAAARLGGSPAVSSRWRGSVGCSRQSIPVRQRRAGTGQDGVGFAGGACAVEPPALPSALFGFGGGHGEVALSKRRRRLPGAGRRRPAAPWASGLAGGTWKAVEGISLLGPYVGSGHRCSPARRCHRSWVVASGKGHTGALWMLQRGLRLVRSLPSPLRRKAAD